jgi:hypothetical protein
MSVQLLLSRNANNVDLIDYFINNNGDRFSMHDPNASITRTLILNKPDNIETGKGIVVNNTTEYVKTERMNYSSAVISDQTFINNLSYFINMYQLNIRPVTIELESVSYYCSTYITVGNNIFYILYISPAQYSTSSE